MKSKIWGSIFLRSFLETQQPVYLFAIPLLLCVSVLDLCLCLDPLLSSLFLLRLRSCCAFVYVLQHHNHPLISILYLKWNIVTGILLPTAGPPWCTHLIGLLSKHYSFLHFLYSSLSTCEVIPGNSCWISLMSSVCLGYPSKYYVPLVRLEVFPWIF